MSFYIICIGGVMPRLFYLGLQIEVLKVSDVGCQVSGKKIEEFRNLGIQEL